MFWRIQSDRIPFYHFWMKGCGLILGRKITMNGHIGQSVAEVYQDFILAKTAEGVSDITITCLRQEYYLHPVMQFRSPNEIWPDEIHQVSLPILPEICLLIFVTVWAFLLCSCCSSLLFYGYIITKRRFLLHHYNFTFPQHEFTRLKINRCEKSVFTADFYEAYRNLPNIKISVLISPI